MGCNFQALRSPNIDILVQMLQDHPDYIGFRDKIHHFSSVGRERLGSKEFWDPFAKNIIVGVKVCITGDKKELNKMKKDLTMMERHYVRQFASTQAPFFTSRQIVVYECQSLLNVLCSSFVSLLKHEMCRGVTQQSTTVTEVIDRAFSMANEDIEQHFAGLVDGDSRSVKSLKECLYYVAGWHAHSIKKASAIRSGTLEEVLCTVFNNIIVDKDIATQLEMPIQKVERVELFGGLKYVCDDYFFFILRMEYVFMSMFTPERLVMMGSGLITSVYNALSSSRNVIALVNTFCVGGCGEVDDDVMLDLVKVMTRSYCRMRGKDFVRKYMQHNFKNKNLGKGIRPTLAIISDPKVRKALTSAASNNTKAAVLSASDAVFNDTEMHTLMEYTCQVLADDKLIKVDEMNLFQEANV